QYIKNVYLNQRKSFGRKIKELYYAIKLEQVASKDEILTGYLNCIYLGHDIYGIGDAAKYYFNTSYEDLTVAQMTTLVALLNAPTYYSNHLKELDTRKNTLLEILLRDGIITQEEYTEAVNPIQFIINPKIYDSNLLFYSDVVLKELESLNIHPKFNKSLTIHTRYNTEMNQLSFSSNSNYASIAVDKEGYILSIIGDKDYYTSSFNIVTQGKRDIGSTIKPILYYEALKCGFNTTTTYYSGPYSFLYHDELVTIKNNASVYPYKNIAMREALATSDNIYAIKTHQALGFKTLANHLKKYNISATALPSLALGSVGLSLFDLTRIYSQFFTEGTFLDFKAIESIQRENQTIYKRDLHYQVLGEATYFKTIKGLMSSVFDSSIPHATAASIRNQLKTKCYGKSGLTDYDSYMMGFNEDILVGVWAGYLDNQALEDAQTKRLPKEIFVDLINAYN
ncbi:MAG: penicillin-binding protein, partial [Anaeroplasmataceae bacterium]|nr:penicillin-binding protein [Anaeroplasmataceae bacterium]